MKMEIPSAFLKGLGCGRPPNSFITSFVVLHTCSQRPCFPGWRWISYLDCRLAVLAGVRCILPQSK